MNKLRIKRRRGKNNEREKGQAMVEFALILPLLLLLICGICELSWLLMGKLSLENAVREGARAGSVCADTIEASAAAEERILALVTDEVEQGLSLDISYTGGEDFRNGDIVIHATAQIEPLTPIAGVFGLEYIPISSQCVMKMN